MSIGKRIEESILALYNNDLEGALLPLVTSIDATAKKEFPKTKENKSRYEKWLRKHQGFVTWYLLRGAELQGNISLQNNIRLESALYKWLRCPISHEAQLDHYITLTEAPILGTTQNGMMFSRRHAEGLILAVICSPSNDKERSPTNILIPFIRGGIRINKLWGKQDVVRHRLNLLTNCWDFH